MLHICFISSVWLEITDLNLRISKKCKFLGLNCNFSSKTAMTRSSASFSTIQIQYAMFCVYYFSIIPRYLRHLPQIKNLLSLSERESTNLLRAELRHSKSGSTRIATGYLKMRNTDYTRRASSVHLPNQNTNKQRIEDMKQFILKSATCLRTQYLPPPPPYPPPPPPYPPPPPP